jgi:hypothetical protein
VRGVRGEDGARLPPLGMVLGHYLLRVRVRRATYPSRRPQPRRVWRSERCYERYASYLAAASLSQEHQRCSGSSRAVGWSRQAVTIDGLDSIIAVGACLVAFIARVAAHYLAVSV